MAIEQNTIFGKSSMSMVSIASIVNQEPEQVRSGNLS
jgi:hypothetical protein